jgi:Zn-dependent M28 family amino/carboxypeptidase
VEITITSQEVENYNILAEKPGRSADSLWILGAHYDHLGRVGRTIFWGANDNASGVAFLLLLAKRLQAKTLPYNILFVAFGAEEVGLIGAYDFVNRYKTRLPMTKGMLNFDLMGFGEKGLGVVGAADQPAFWAQVKAHQPTSLQGVPLLLRPNAPNSDHYPFRQQGCPAFFFYLMGGPGYYHDPMDRPETLSWMGAYELSRWVEAVIRGN